MFAHFDIVWMTKKSNNVKERMSELGFTFKYLAFLPPNDLFNNSHHIRKIILFFGLIANTSACLIEFLRSNGLRMSSFFLDQKFFCFRFSTLIFSLKRFSPMQEIERRVAQLMLLRFDHKRRKFLQVHTYFMQDQVTPLLLWQQSLPS